MRTKILRLNSHLEGELRHGERIFPVQCALPGDEVEYEVIGRGRRRRVLLHSVSPALDPFLAGPLADGLAEGPAAGIPRAEPFCAHFGRCGGCRAQHIAYPQQFFLKAAPYVAGMQQHFGLDVQCIEADPVRRYRNRMDFVVGAGVVGLRPAGSFRGFIDIESCGIQRQRANDVLRIARGLFRRFPGAAHYRKAREGAIKYLTLREGSKSGAAILTLCEGTANTADYVAFRSALVEALDEYEALHAYPFSLIECESRPLSEISAVPGGRAIRGALSFEESMGPLVFRVPYDAFFQPNPPGFYRLFDAALRFAEQQCLWAPGPILDLYCGSAVLSLVAADRHGEDGAHRVQGIYGADFSETGVALGRCNIEDYLAASGRAFPFRLEARDLTRGEMDFPDAALAILDPPRAGLAQGMIEWLCEKRPTDTILSIACSPMVQIENLKKLAGAYRPVFAAVADVFPHTAHLESAVVLQRITPP